MSSSSESSSALYRAVWRWHFYAGLITAPFAMFLAVTGALYLWKPQYEEWRYHALFHVPAQSATVAAEAQFAAAQAAHPSARAIQFLPATAPGRTAEVQFGPGRGAKGGDKFSVFVNPHTGAVVGRLSDADRAMRVIHDLHGTLLAGQTGEIIVEIAASWLFVLLLTGFYLWWPRPGFTVWGFLLPRLRANGRVFWRDLHAVPAIWFTAGALFLLGTGMPWTKVGGAWIKTLSAAIGQGSPRESSAGAHRSELTGWSPPLQAGLAQKIDSLASTPIDEHAEHRVAVESKIEIQKSKVPRISLDRVIAVAAEHHVPAPYAIALPVGPAGVLSAITDRNLAFDRAFLHLDQYSGKVLADVRYADYGVVGKFFLWGIIAHEGQLFGLLNQLLGTLAAFGVFAVSASGLVLWWQRRPAGRLAAPAATVPLPRPVLLGTVALAAFLPLLAATLTLLLIVDRVMGRRLPALNPT